MCQDDHHLFKNLPKRLNKLYRSRKYISSKRTKKSHKGEPR
nr:MAG TPA: hypothetical protein [Caudoviricetes sp.]